MNYIAAYGTLKKGFYNNSRFKNNYIETAKIDGYQLYDLGPYPAVIRDENAKDLVVDVLEVDDNEKQAIDRMEQGAGYHLETVNINGRNCTIYTFTKKMLIYHGGKKVETNEYL